MAPINSGSRFPLLAALYLLLIATSSGAQEKDIVGWLEKVRIFPTNLVVHGKLDTGADYSSLNAANLQEFEKDGVKWVRFDLANRYGERATIEREVMRTAMVKRHFGKPQKRLVIRLGICVGSRYMEADVNLVDRTNFENQMLIGRSFLAGNVIVDPSMTFTAEPECRVATKATSKPEPEAKRSK